MRFQKFKKHYSSFIKYFHLRKYHFWFTSPLIIDNCPAHPNVQNLNWVELIFIPPNTTSITQPKDQGVIRLLKSKYCSLAVKYQIAAFEKGKEMPNFSLLTALFMLTKVLNSFPDQMFINCLKKSGITHGSVERAINDEDDPFSGLSRRM